jgi:hypothetical protein
MVSQPDTMRVSTVLLPAPACAPVKTSWCMTGKEQDGALTGSLAFRLSSDTPLGSNPRSPTPPASPVARWLRRPTPGPCSSVVLRLLRLAP